MAKPRKRKTKTPSVTVITIMVVLSTGGVEDVVATQTPASFKVCCSDAEHSTQEPFPRTAKDDNSVHFLHVPLSIP
eukprot:Pgem_evm1s15934